MNIEMQCAGLIVLLILMVFYTRRKPIGLYSEFYFKHLMIITLVNVIAEICTVAVLTMHEVIPGWICIGVARVHLVLLIWVTAFGVVYISQDIYKGVTRNKVKTLFMTLACIGTLIVSFFPIKIYHEGRIVYTYGASVYATYAFCVYYIAMTFAVVIINRKRVSRARIEAAILWNLVWLSAAVIQFLWNEILVVDFASCVGMMILFFELENPEAAVDRMTGVYNSHVFYVYLAQLFDKKKSASILMVSVDQRFIDKTSIGTIRVLQMVEFLESLEGVKVFKGVNTDFVLVFEDRALFEEGINKTMERFEQPWDGRIYEPLYLSIANSLMAESSEEIYHLIRYYKNHFNMTNVHKLIEINREMVQTRREYAEMIKTIGNALKEDRVEVFYQPIYHVRKELFTTAEALVRIRNTDGTYVQPGKFIPVAEETGMINQLGERVFEKVCQFIMERKIWELGIDYVEVNLSVYQCESRHLSEKYLKIMDKYGVDPSMINLEVTESASIQTKKIFMQNMNDLIEHGVSITLDDFGNGESNLNYIVDMPVEIVKFDRDMTKAYFEKSKGRIVMETTTNMIQDMGLKIVSEGIETEEQLHAVKKLGVQFIQGFYFSKPLPENEFIEFVKAW